MHTKRVILIVLLFAVLWGSIPGRAQGEEPDTRLDRTARLAVIDWACEQLNAIYVFPDTARAIEKSLRKKFKKGRYRDITDPREFARALSEDMMAVAHDKHMRLYYSVEPSLRLRMPDPEQEKKQREQRVINWQYENFGFRKVEMLEGNVGYLRFDEFTDSYFGGDTAVAALNFLSFCDALIIDLRYNGGGHENMVELISGYFFHKEQLLLERYNRRENKTVQSRTDSHVAGRRLADVDLFILTARRTFSAAEAFTFALKNLKRATVVGEVTGGGAHTVETVRSDKLKMEFRVPDTRAYDPETGKDWEGVGVLPDVPCPAEQALEKAHLLALEKVHEKTGDQGDKKEWLAWLIRYLKTKIHPVAVEESMLKSYAGSYGPVQILFESGELWVIQPGRTQKERLLAMAADAFIIEGEPEIRLKFETDDQGTVVAALGIFFDGSSRRIPRNQ